MINIKKIMLTTFLFIASFHVIMESAFAEIPENSTIEVTINNVDSNIVFDNTSDITEFTLNLTDETEIINNLSERLNATITEIEAITIFRNSTTTEQNNFSNTKIEVLILKAQDISEVTILENSTQIDNFTLNLIDEDTIVAELALMLNATNQDILDIISFQINNSSINDSVNTLENIQIKVLLNENENLTEVTIFENGIQINSFILNTTNTDDVVNEIATKLNANEDDVISSIIHEIMVNTTVGEWTLFVFFDNFLKLYNVVDNNVNGENPFPPKMNINSGRVLSQDTNFSNMDSPIVVAVEYDKWLMFKFFKMYIDSENVMLLTQKELTS